MNKQQIIVHVEKNLSYTPFDIVWLPKSAKVIVLGSYPNTSGAFEIYELETSTGSLNLVLKQECLNSLKCGTFGASSFEERQIATGDFKGNLQIFDICNSKSPVYSAQAHSDIINCIDGVGGLRTGKGAPEIATGSKDGSIKIWDQRQKDIPALVIEPETEREKRDCWSVCFGNSFSNDDRIICAGFDNGDLKMFDLRTNSLLWETQLENGICGLQFDRKDINMNKLVVTSLESSIDAYDLRTLHPEKGFARLRQKAHESTVWTAKHLPQDRDIFMTGGGNGTLCLWKYTYPSKRSRTLDDGTNVGVMGELVRLQDTPIASQPITSFDWSRDRKGLGACIGLDQTARIVLVTKLNTA